jgi:hypothetical protein
LAGLASVELLLDKIQIDVQASWAAVNNSADGFSV